MEIQMERAAVFAHYDKDNIIDDYVIYYLNSLKEVCTTIIFVSCCDLQENEKEKLSNIVSYIIAEKHDEYDFGSYKRGFNYLSNNNLLENFDELIFANDSCYGPLYSFIKVFSEMETRACDFWGISKNNYGIRKKFDFKTPITPHIQSFFIVFKKQVFLSECFINFINSITKLENKYRVVTLYEVGLSTILVKNGFRFATFINLYEHIENPMILKWRDLVLNYNLPLLKCSLLRLINRDIATVEGYENVIKSVSDYPVDLITENVKRISTCKFRRFSAPIWIKMPFFDFMSKHPFIKRKFKWMFTTIFHMLMD